MRELRARLKELQHVAIAHEPSGRRILLSVLNGVSRSRVQSAARRFGFVPRRVELPRQRHDLVLEPRDALGRLIGGVSVSLRDAHSARDLRENAVFEVYSSRKLSEKWRRNAVAFFNALRPVKYLRIVKAGER